MARLMPLRVRQSQGVADYVSALPGAHRRCVGAKRKSRSRFRRRLCGVMVAGADLPASVSSGVIRGPAPLHCFSAKSSSSAHQPAHSPSRLRTAALLKGVDFLALSTRLGATPNSSPVYPAARLTEARLSQSEVLMPLRGASASKRMLLTMQISSSAHILPHVNQLCKGFLYSLAR